MKIGIIKETKTPVDHRVAFTPDHCKQILKNFPHTQIVVQPSDIRCYSDEEYSAAGAILSEDVSTCKVLFGVKEVKIEKLIPNKTYFFFSHTIKKQPYNKSLLQNILEKKIQLVDYECLKGTDGNRVVAFGRWAGIVGAYNAIRAYGIKHELYDIKPAHQCFDRTEMWTQFAKVSLPNIKILLTGGGRVTKGAQEVLDAIGIKNVAMPDFIQNDYSEAVYIQLDSDAYNKRIDGNTFDYAHFYANPEKYESNFEQYLPHTDLLIAGAYWDPKAPALFTIENVKSSSFKINTIADITCDIEGSIPTTIRSTTIEAPFYDFSKTELIEKAPFSDLSHITVMAVDNLPCELPRDASSSFGDMLCKFVIPTLLGEENSEIISNASITKSGSLTSKFSYLSDYVV